MRKTSKKSNQDTCVYELYDKNRKVYCGTTNDLSRREDEHRADGKKFTRVKKVSINMTAESAKKRESEKLEAYRKNHRGKNPRYNKDSDG
jgi:predicted GIY-YIG superfamily endonuclease